MESTLQEYEHNELGKVHIAPEVIEIIAGLAASEVNGVAHMSGGFVGDLAERLGRKNLSKGVRVEVGEKEAAVDVSVIVAYGQRIPEVAQQIQDNVRQAIGTMTGLNVVEVNVHVVDVNVTGENREDSESEEEEV